MDITKGDTVRVRIDGDSTNLTREARVLHLPVGASGSWGLKCLKSGCLYYVPSSSANIQPQ